MRRRILLAIGGTLLGMLLIISLASSALLRDSYAALERRYIERDVRRMVGAITREAAGLGRTVEDYSAWTEMYRFVQHPSTEFTKRNFTDDSTENVRVNLVIAENAAGKIVYRQAFGDAGRKGGMLDDMTQWVEQHSGLVRISDRNGTAEGVVGLSTGLVVLASRPILDDLRTLPVGGTLIMGRVFDDAAVQQIGTQLLVRVKVYSLNGAPLPEPVRRAREKLSVAAPVYMDTTQAAMASMFTALDGLDGAPAALVQVDLPRDIREQGTRTVRYFYIWLFFVGAAFGGVVLLTIERTVLSRLVHLGTSMLAIGTGGDSNRRIEILGSECPKIC
jgi:sensor domain CHASE-containing protein